jgi:putative hydrolase of the HAD superfamily
MKALRDATPSMELGLHSEEQRREWYRMFNRALLRSLGVDIDDAMAVQIFQDIQKMPFLLYPDVLSTLQTLQQHQGIKLGVLSNWAFTLPQVLQHLGIDTFFTHILTSHALGVAKPDPRFFHLALGHIGTVDALYIGDTPAKDIFPAREAGIFPVLIDRTLQYRSCAIPCPSIETLAQLPAVLSEWMT